ncbi:MAG: hypothetical protein A2W99_07510 [Bacteroidetes bacterium GWF2_33_16]|nr:MAG: hypothetical protein A2X00_10460 [Bacteroidetes bacterium GWE2_32_14]OFY03055.1 MAG: hypothetical protein A2W99_07510 [Bacteroidetes bacterium GWF2_33_16]
MLITKLHIPSHGNNIIHRPELSEKLNQGLNRKLILVSAPAGFGKTTVVSDWINQNKIPTSWYSIDKSDNDPVEFLNYIITGIQSIHPEFGKRAITLLNSPNFPSNQSILSLLINDLLQIKLNFLLVLDDFHLITDKDILELVTYLLEHIPGNIHIVILTRSDPALSISKLRSQHQLVEIRSSDLSFSANDISILFNKKLKLKLSIEDSYSLETKTEGWIAGLQLAALSMQGKEDFSKFIQDLKGDNRYIMDYLMEEVLKNQTDDIKEFLLQTSILEQMSAPLCNAILNRNDSQLILELLEKNNMFVFPLDSERNWFRYHHLFADLLKQRLHLREKATVVELHNKAIEWFNTNSMPALAIEHAIETGNFEKSIQLLGEIVEPMWKNGQHAAIMKYGDLLPHELIKKNAEFCLYYAWILIISGQIQKADPFLVSAENITMQIINDKNSSKEDILCNKKLLGKIAVAFAYLFSIIRQSEKAYDYSKIAMENLSEDDPMWFSWGWFSIGMTKTIFEDFKGSIDAYEKALEYGKKSENIYLISTIAINLIYLESRMGLYTSSYKKCTDLLKFMKENGYSQIAKSESSFAGLYSCLAGIESMRSEFEDALENIKTAYGLCKKESNNSFKVVVLTVYSITLYGLGNLVDSLKMINEAEEIIKQNKVAQAAVSIFISWKGFLLIEQNNFEKANHFFKKNGLEFNKEISYIDEHEYCAYALLLILEMKFEEAEILLSKLLIMAQTANRIERIIEHKILFAILYKARGNKEKALTNLIEAMEYAATDNILFGFIYNLDRISDLLNEVYKIEATTKTKIPKKLIDKLKFAIEKKENLKKPTIQLDLSVRELDILKHLSEDISNQQIADKLFISMNTVKTHIKNVFLKLEVNNRTKAIMRAKELGLI